MRHHPPFTLALSLAALAVAAACLADPEPGGSPPDPLPPTVPKHGGLGIDPLAQGCRGYGEPQEPFETCDELIGRGGRCNGIGEVLDATTGKCRCIGNLEWNSKRKRCDMPSLNPKPKPGGPVGSLGGGGSGPKDTGEHDPDEDKLTLTLECDPGTLVRGGNVECLVTPENNNGDVRYRWRFVPENEGVKIWDHGGGLQSLSPVKEVPGDSAWEGTAAHGGRVSVLAVDDEWYAHVHVDFEVTPRSGWKVAEGNFTRGPDLDEYLTPARALLGLNTTRNPPRRLPDQGEGGGSSGSVPLSDKWYVGLTIGVLALTMKHLHS